SRVCCNCSWEIRRCWTSTSPRRSFSGRPAGRAAAGGAVKAIGNDPGGFGNYVRIDHGDGYSTLYAHLKDGSIKVTEGQPVETGQELGVIGTTGASTGTHLHFEVEFDGASRSGIAALDAVLLGERKIIDYKVEPAPQYFVSTNTP
ncbi:MAG: M23 family metallopeptidase, partial [Chloroflexi bacterium]|nr:M23 family metallopeptidase [Chloroflexota bacterium]